MMPYPPADVVIPPARAFEPVLPHSPVATLPQRQAAPIAAPVPTEMIPQEELEEWRMHARNVIYNEETEAAMHRYMDAKERIAATAGHVPLEIRAREAALARMRTGRSEIESYHQNLLTERKAVVSITRAKQQQDIDDYKKYTAQPYKAISPRRIRKSHRIRKQLSADGVEKEIVEEVEMDAADADSEDEDQTLRAMAKARLQDRDTHFDIEATSIYHDRMVTSRGTAPPLIPRDPWLPGPEPVLLSPPPPPVPPVGFAAPIPLPYPGIIPAPLPSAVAVTDVTGANVSPQGRTLLADRRSPAERAANRASAAKSASEALSERRQQESSSWEEKRALAVEKARAEWEAQEAERRAVLEDELAGRLMGEMDDLKKQTDAVRRSLNK